MKFKPFIIFVGPSILMMILFISVPLVTVFWQSFHLTQKVYEEVEVEESFVNNSTNDEKFYKILFGEDAGNYIVIINNEEKVKELAKKNKVSLFKIGIMKKNYLNINNQIIKLNELKNNFENNFFNYINN